MSAPTDQLMISEIFASIQGEGSLLGTPSIFIRTSGCNLRCQWGDTRCDTPYTSWDARGSMLTIPHILEQVEGLRDRRERVNHVVLTGGEPTLFQAMVPLSKALKKLGLHVTVETNGTLPLEVEADLISLSPKLASSVPTASKFAAMHESKRINAEALCFYLSRYAYQLKFVINEPDDEQEIVGLLESLATPVDPERVYLMPQGVTVVEMASHAGICAGVCLRRGWRFTPRAHIEIYGNSPGT